MICMIIGETVGLSCKSANGSGALSDILDSGGEGQVGGYAQTSMFLDFVIAASKDRSLIQTAITHLCTVGSLCSCH